MVNDGGRKRLPPYVSYRTFCNFTEGLQAGIPSRFDRSYWGDRLSGSSGTQLMAALRFLGLIDGSGIPTARLRQLATARGERKTEILKELASDAYSFLFRGTLDPQSATYAQLEELFHSNFQLTGDVSRKCIKFFVALASDASLPLSPFITKRIRTAHSGTGTKVITKRTGTRTKQNVVVPQNLGQVPVLSSWDEMLLAKFPTFDPSWSEELKIKWFEAFDEILSRGLVRGEKKE